jgi:hypothetical protein
MVLHDRSFVYGFILRRFVVRPHSFLSLVLVRVVLSGFASRIVDVCLVRFFRANFVLDYVISDSGLSLKRKVTPERSLIYAIALMRLFFGAAPILPP